MNAASPAGEAVSVDRDCERPGFNPADFGRTVVRLLMAAGLTAQQISDTLASMPRSRSAVYRTVDALDAEPFNPAAILSRVG